MAVICCPDCKKEMSDTASVCPNCGYPYAQKKALYLKAVKLMQGCTTSDGFLGVAELFHGIPEFQDSASLEEKCRAQAELYYRREKEREEQERQERLQREQEQRNQWEQEQIRQEQERIRRIEEEKQRRELEWREKQERIEKQQAFFKKHKTAIIIVGVLIFSGAIATQFILNKQIAVQSSTVSAGIASTVVLKDDNSVAVISSEIGHGIENQANVSAISCGDTILEKTLLLLSDGTVVGYDWKNVISVAAGGWHDVGLKSDGTVVATGDNTYNQCNTSSWTDIKVISAGDRHTVGVKEDGTVVATGDNRFGQCDVSAWNDILSVSAGSGYTIGLKSDGTVLATGMSDLGQCNVSEWEDIAAISAGASHTVAIKKDGTVIAAGSNEYGQCNVGEWRNIVAVSAGLKHTVGLESDGTLVAVGDNTYNQCDVSDIDHVMEASSNYV